MRLIYFTISEITTLAKIPTLPIPRVKREHFTSVFCDCFIERPVTVNPTPNTHIHTPSSQLIILKLAIISQLVYIGLGLGCAKFSGATLHF